MDIETVKEVFEWVLLRTCLISLSVLVASFLSLKVYAILGRLKAAVKRYGWPLVTLFIVCSAWATYTAFPTQEEKNRSQGSVVRVQESEIDTNSTVHFSPSPNLTPNSYPLTPSPYPLSLTQEDFARGFVLTHIGTNEVHDFNAPDGAGICSDWLAFGAAEDWVYLEGSGVSSSGLGCERLRVHSDGWVEALSPTSTVFAAREYYPFKAPLGIVPEANWERIVFSRVERVDRVEGRINVANVGMLPITNTNSQLEIDNIDTDNIQQGYTTSLATLKNLPVSTRSTRLNSSLDTYSPSLFWHCLTPSNTLQLTWQNVLYNRESDMPISFQVEFYENGDFTYRYNLSAIKSKIDSGIIPENFPSNITIGTIPHLPFSIPHSPFPTSFTFRRLDPTDTPGSDRDGDGLTIEDELFVYYTDPYNADSDYDGLSDYDEIFIVKSNPLDAYSISNDYYDGFTSALNGEDPFSYPEGSTNTVLEHIFYSGTTNGVFSLPMPSDETAVLKISVCGSGIGRLIVGKKVVPLVAQARQRSGAVTNTLLLALGRGVKKSFWYEKPEGLEIAIDSDDLLIGMIPSNVFRRGWIAFPHTKSTEPCIHDFVAKNVRVSLVYGEEFSGLTSTWSCDAEDVVITNDAPISAGIYAEFPRSESRSIVYEVDHPLRLNKNNIVHTQELRFCPKLSDEEENVVENDENESPDIERCRCSSVASCDCCSDEWCYCYYSDCPCDKNLAPTLEDDDEDEDDFNSAYMADPLGNVFYLYRSNAYTLHLDVPGGEPKKCCACPSHWGSNYVSKVSATQRVTVKDSNGENFTVAYEPCSVTMSGVFPSRTFADSTVFFFTNGASYKRIDCTVLGVNIESPKNRVHLDTYNNLSARLGFPMEICTNLERAAQLVLRTDVLMTNGVFKISFENVVGNFQAWLPAWREENGIFHESEKLLDSQSRPVRYLSMRKWRSLLRRYKDASKINVILTSPTPGSCKLKFEYVAADGGNRVYDFAEQRITSLLPPLRVDLTRDGSIDHEDIDAWLNGRIFRYWTNEDTVKGDYVGADDDDDPNINDDVVNGTYDLVNFFTVTLDFKRFREAWGSQVKYFVRSSSDNAPSFKACFANLSWGETGAIQTKNMTTTAGAPLSSAQLMPLNRNDIEIPYDMLVQFSQDSGVMICEALKPNRTIYVDIRLGDDLLYSYDLPMRISSVREMYRWMNLRYVVGDNSGESSKMWEPDNYPDEECDGKHFVFVHGYNVNASGARIWADAIFKRLWLAGSKSKFTAVDWRGDSSQFSLMFTGMKISPDYYANVKNAFLTAPAFVQGCNNLPGQKVMLAHSLGNMLVSSAAKDHGLNYSKYYMLNAAVPIEAYDIESDEAAMIDAEWTNVPLQYRASDWSKLFPTNDFRSLLSWRGRFEGIANAVNCYSPTEDVLANAEVGQLTFSGGAWKIQEMTKGTTVWHEINLLPFLDLDVACEGGWGINTYYSVNPLWYMYQYGFTDKVQSDMTHKDAIIHPLFTPFRSESEAMHSTNLFTIADTTYRKQLRAKFLADAIPATSFAAGANETGGGVLNYNMQIGTPNGWPESRSEEKDGNIVQYWYHSDIKNVSYYYVYKLFEKFIKEN